ncbi:MAG: hypothetical protein ACK5KO_05325 [Arachnia sp.]
MGDLGGLLIAVAVGLPLLAFAAWWDARTRRRRDREARQIPVRGDAEVDAMTPAYLTQDDIDAMPDPAGPASGHSVHGTEFDFGWAHQDFCTNAQQAEWRNARVLITVDPITAFRALITPLDQATTEHPLVIVAPEFSGEVLHTLAANRRAFHAPVLAAAVPLDRMAGLLEAVGGEALTGADLMAGYIPDSAVGRAAHWVSGARTTQVRGESGPEAEVRLEVD